MTLHIRAPVKVNLCLHVGPVRDDGFHELASLAVFPDFGDDLAAEPAGDLSLEINGPFAAALSGLPDAENLVLKAARSLAAECGVADGAKLTLTKNVPVASGIGGGTADAVAALVSLRSLWQADISDELLYDLAFRLGADGPVCLASHLMQAGSVIMTGAGEHVRPGPAVPPLWICLINPGQQVSTGSIFNGFDSQNKVPEKPVLPRFNTMVEFAEQSRNDLQPFAQSECPEIATVLSLLESAPGIMMARMSGSGATCFGLFEDEAGAAVAEARAAERRWWSASARLPR